MGIIFSLQNLRTPMRVANDRLLRHGIAGVYELLLLADAIAFIGIAVALMTGGYHGGFHYLHRLSQAVLPDEAWEWLTWFGDGRVLLVISLLFVRRCPDIFWAMIIGAVIGAVFTHEMKLAFDELRPPAVLPAEEIRLIGHALRHHSFPSGHTLSVFLFVGVLFAYRDSWFKRLLSIVAATLVGISRVALGVHWPQDVIAGAFSGLLIAALAVAIARYWRVGLRPTVHVGLLIVPAIAIVLMLLDDQGNPWEPELIVPIAIVGLTALVMSYRDLVTFGLQKNAQVDHKGQEGPSLRRLKHP